MLTGKQKRYLRSLGTSLDPVVLIGKEGLNDNLIESAKLVLEKRELIKVKILKTCPTDTEEVIFDLAMHTRSEVAQVIGRTFLLYKKGKEPKIVLP